MLTGLFTENEGLIWLFGALIVFIFLVTMISVPLIIIHIPTDYFTLSYRQRKTSSKYHPLIRFIILLIKNILGFILLVMGIMLLALPGQGLLTILVGIALLDFPGKYQSERWLVQKKPVLFAVNWLRNKRGKASLKFDDIEPVS